LFRSREDASHAAQRAGHGMQPARKLAPLGQRDVEPLGGELRVEPLGLERPPARLENLRQGGLRLVDGLAGRRALLGRQAPSSLRRSVRRPFLPRYLTRTASSCCKSPAACASACASRSSVSRALTR